MYLEIEDSASMYLEIEDSVSMYLEIEDSVSMYLETEDSVSMYFKPFNQNFSIDFLEINILVINFFSQGCFSHF
jgi:hypothetical protein